MVEMIGIVVLACNLKLLPPKHTEITENETDEILHPWLSFQVNGSGYSGTGKGALRRIPEKPHQT